MGTFYRMRLIGLFGNISLVRPENLLGLNVTFRVDSTLAGARRWSAVSPAPRSWVIRGAIRQS